ncbi:unnamed protein product [Protopolystoma xenopodis]|uniref:ABC transporter domain-containing protein n=1 Tax=Protopolystoma xenopodis TaxID=117903 RepID=A0A3S5CL85_9PLAT|nr:unnamed protein product [Protopolystoma xenopodis]
MEVLEICRLANDTSQASSLLDRDVGESGHCLSSGERQLVCLARIILANRAKRLRKPRQCSILKQASPDQGNILAEQPTSYQGFPIPDVSPIWLDDQGIQPATKDMPSCVRAVDSYEQQDQAICLSELTEPAIICLDEVTSSVDEEKEKFIYEILDREFRGSTILFIAHRLSSVLQFCNQAIVMDAGKVVETGLPSLLVADPESVFSRMLLEHTSLTSLLGSSVL